MTPLNRLLVAGNDPGFIQIVQGHLRDQFERPALACRYDAVRQHVGPATDGLLLALVSQPGDALAAREMLQELQLLGYPPRVVLLESASGLADALGAHEQRLTGRRSWHQCGAEIKTILEDHLTAGIGFLNPAQESLPERIARRLAATPSLAHLVEPLALAAGHDVTVLIEGEASTGKTFLARLIHDCSARSANRFLAVSCGAEQLENELFGHAKGSAGAADTARIGKLTAAGSGTLVLDEIDALPAEIQAKLLRVLETGEFEPAGGVEAQMCQARLIAAGNWSLEDAVERGAFRRDLLYRLNVMSFHLPPLRDRPQDIEPLVRGLVARFAVKFRKELLRIHPETLRVLAAYDWPGNLRQLENVVQQAVLLSTGPELLLKNLAAIIHNRCPAIYAPSGGTLNQSRQAAERVSILRALEANDYCRSRAAAALNISRVTLYKKMRLYGLLSRPARQTTVASSK